MLGNQLIGIEGWERRKNLTIIIIIIIIKVKELQKTAILGTAHILRKVLM